MLREFTTKANAARLLGLVRLTPGSTGRSPSGRRESEEGQGAGRPRRGGGIPFANVEPWDGASDEEDAPIVQPEPGHAGDER